MKKLTDVVPRHREEPHFAAASATVVDQIVDADLVAGVDRSASDDFGAAVDVSLPGVGIAGVVVVAVGDAVEDYLAVGIGAVIGPLVEVGPQRRRVGDLTEDAHDADGFALGEGAAGEDARSFHARRSKLDVRIDVVGLGHQPFGCPSRDR